MRADTERARDDVRNTLTQAQQAARDFRNEMYQLRDAQLRAREAVVAAREAFHQTQIGITKAKDALHNYTTELKRAQEAQSRAATDRTKLAAQVESAQKAYDNARKGLAFGAYSGAETAQSKAALDNLNQLKQRLGDANKAYQSASGSVGYYTRQVKQAKQDIGALNSTLTSHNLSIKKATDDSARLATTKSALSNRMAENRDQTRDLTATLRTHEQALKDDDAAHKQLANEGMTAAVAAGTLLANLLSSIASRLRDLAVETIQYAARTEELGVALSQVARINGISAGAISEQETAMKRLNITTQDARSVLSQFVVTQLDLSKASQLARAAQDLGVIAGRDTSDELQHLLQGIETLQIRTLRTAGVFVSLEGALRKAAIASGRSTESFSEQEKQQLLMNEVLNFGARAVGTYEAAMTTAAKQQRSMNRLWAEAENAVGSLFQGPFLIAIKATSKLLQAIADFPVASTAFIVGLTAIAGGLALTTAASLGWTTVLSAKLTVLKEVTIETLKFAGATQTAAAAQGEAAVATAATSAGIGASILLWAGILAAIGAVVYIIYKYVTAQRQANYQKDEEFRLALRSIKVNQEDAANLRERAKLIGVSAATQLEATQQQKEYHMALLRLAPDQQLAITQQNDQAKAYEMTAAALDALNEKQLDRIRIGASADAFAFGQGTRQREQLEKEYQQTKDFAERAQREGLQGMDAFRRALREVFGVGGAAQGETLDEYLNTYKKQNLDAQQKILAEQESAARRAAEFIGDIGQRQYGPQFDAEQYIQKFIPELKKGTAAYNEFAAAINNALEARREAASYNASEEAFLQDYAKELEKLRISQIELQNVEEGRLQLIEQLNSRMQFSINKLGNFNDAVALNRNAANHLNDALANSASTQEEYNARIAALPELLQQLLYAAKVYGARGIEQIGEAAGKQQRVIADLSIALRTIRRELAELFAGGGQLGGLVTQHKLLEQLKSETESIVQMRAELGVRQGEPINTTREERLAESRELKNEIDARDAIRTVIFEEETAKRDASIAMIAATLRVVDAETLAARDIAKAQRQRRIDEQELTAEILRLSAERQANAANEAGITLRAYKTMVREQLRTDLEVQDRIAALRAKLAPPNIAGLYQLPSAQDIKLTLPDEQITPQVRALQSVEANTAATVQRLDKVVSVLTQDTFANPRSPDMHSLFSSGLAGRTTGNQYYDQLILQNAQAKGIDPLFILSMMRQESGFKPGATSNKNAQGLMQIIPGTFSRFGGAGRSPYDPAASIDVGTNYIRHLIKTFGADRPDLVLSAYNAGEGAVQKFGGIPPYKETQQYVSSILNMYRGMRGNLIATTGAIAQPHPDLDTMIKAFVAKGMSSGEIPTDPNALIVAALSEAQANANTLSGRPGFDDTGFLRRTALTADERNQDYFISRYGIKGRRDDVVTSETNVAQLESITERIVNIQGNITDAVAAASGFSALISGAGTTNATLQAQSRALQNVRDLIVSSVEAASDSYDKLNALNNEYYQHFLNSEEHLTQIAVNGALTRKQAEIDALEDIKKLRDDTAHAWEGATARIALSYEKAVNDIAHADEAAFADVAANTARIADNQQLHLSQLQAGITGWAASQKSVTESVSDLFTGTIDAGFGGLEKILSARINQNTVLGSTLKDSILGIGKSAVAGLVGQLFGGVPGLESQDNNLRSVQRMDIQTAGQVIINGAGTSAAGVAGAISNFAGVPAPIVQAIQRGIIPSSPQQGTGVFNIGSTGVVTNATGTPIGILPSASGIRGIGMGNGSITGAGAASNAALASIFGGGIPGASSVAGVGAFSNNAQVAAVVQSVLHEQGHAGIGPATQVARTGSGGVINSVLSGANSFFGQNIGGGKFGGLFAQSGFGFGNSAFAGLLPFLGASAGGMLGGPSRLGGALGTIGGLLAGIGLIAPTGIFAGAATGGIGAALGGGAAAGGGGALGFLAPLFSNPITAIAGGALLVGAILLGRNARRRQEEKQRTQILGDAKSQLQQILNAVQRDRMDGASAMAQAQQIRQQYLDSVGQLKDKKTRNIATATVRELDALITQINVAAKQQERRQELDRLLVPEFATGGPVSSAYTYGQGRGGAVPGVDMGGDTVLARLRPHEVVMNMHQQRRAASLYGTDFLRNVGVPGFADGGSYNPSPVTINNRTVNNRQGTTVILVADPKFARDLARQTGGEIINMSAASLKNQDGPLYQEVKRLRG